MYVTEAMLNTYQITMTIACIVIRHSLLYGFTLSQRVSKICIILFPKSVALGSASGL